MDDYSNYIEKCKSPKKAVAIRAIVMNIMTGIRQHLTTKELAEKLNSSKVYTLMKKKWTSNSLQMQILKMARLERDSNLAWGLATLTKQNFITKSDLELLDMRTR